MGELERVLIIVPAYNEQDSIGKTLENLLAHKKNITDYVIDICVINDGSKDNTKDAVLKYADVKLIDLPVNLGIGGAVQTGYKYAYKNDYTLAVQFDADGQHKSEELYKIIAPVLNGDADMCIGSRFLEKTAYRGSLQRRLGIYFFETLLTFFTRNRVTDPTSGFRCINRRIIELFDQDYPKDFPEPEVIMLLNKRNYTVREVSVEMDSREMGASSITPLKSIYYMLKVSLAVFVRKIEKGAR